MPRLALLRNIAIRVYLDDTKKHRRPHFHAVGPDRNAVIALPSLEVIEGDLVRGELAEVLRWAQANLDRLIEQWNDGNPKFPVR
jgi:hypothetical protein